jgi:hypothetical protein
MSNSKSKLCLYRQLWPEENPTWPGGLFGSSGERSTEFVLPLCKIAFPVPETDRNAPKSRQCRVLSHAPEWPNAKTMLLGHSGPHNSDAQSNPSFLSQAHFPLNAALGKGTCIIVPQYRCFCRERCSKEQSGLFIRSERLKKAISGPAGNGNTINYCEGIERYRDQPGRPMRLPRLVLLACVPILDCHTRHPRQSLLNMNPVEFHCTLNWTTFLLFHITIRESQRPLRRLEDHSPNNARP